jgi:peptidoglycan/LPS O-acetylase OafA/YrhL
MSVSRRSYTLLSWVLLACVIVQILIAGLGVFVSSDYWAMHRTFVHVFELIPVLLFILSFPARLRGVPRWLPVVSFVLIALQYATVASRPSYLAALHPVNAVLLAVACVAQSAHWEARPLGR